VEDRHDARPSDFSDSGRTERRSPRPSLTSKPRPETVSVTIVVPADRAYRFKDHAKRWLKGTAHTEWRASDHELAARLWQRLDIARRQVLGVLIDDPGRRFRASELVELTSAAPGPADLVRLLGTVSNLSHGLCRAWPWHFDYPDGKGKGKPGVYWMEPDVAELFRNARDASDPTKATSPR
jgi:hypothetical protein